jgi:hypothetical protein
MAACAAPKPPPAAAPPPSSLIVLLPDTYGTVGQITITTSSGTQVLTQGRQASTIQGAAAMPSAPFVVGEGEITRTFGPTLAALPADPVHFILFARLDDLAGVAKRSRCSYRAVRERTPLTSASLVTPTRWPTTNTTIASLRRANRSSTCWSQGVDRSSLNIDSHGKMICS